MADIVLTLVIFVIATLFLAFWAICRSAIKEGVIGTEMPRFFLLPKEPK